MDIIYADSGTQGTYIRLNPGVINIARIYNSAHVMAYYGQPADGGIMLRAFELIPGHDIDPEAVRRALSLQAETWARVKSAWPDIIAGHIGRHEAAHGHLPASPAGSQVIPLLPPVPVPSGMESSMTKWLMARGYH